MLAKEDSGRAWPLPSQHAPLAASRGPSTREENGKSSPPPAPLCVTGPVPDMPRAPKTEETQELIRDAISNMFIFEVRMGFVVLSASPRRPFLRCSILFIFPFCCACGQSLTPSDLTRLIDFFNPLECAAGDVVLEPGDTPNHFAVVDSGRFE